MDFLPSSTVGQVISVSLSLVAHNVVPLVTQQKPRTFVVMMDIKLDRNKQRSFICATAYQHLCCSLGISGPKPLLMIELKGLHLCFKV